MAVGAVMMVADRSVAAPGLIGLDIDLDQMLVRLSVGLTQMLGHGNLIRVGSMFHFVRRFGPGVPDQRRGKRDSQAEPQSADETSHASPKALPCSNAARLTRPSQAQRVSLTPPLFSPASPGSISQTVCQGAQPHWKCGAHSLG